MVFRGQRVTQIYTSVTVIIFEDDLILQMDVWSKDSILFDTKSIEIPMRGNGVRTIWQGLIHRRQACFENYGALGVKEYLYFFLDNTYHGCPRNLVSPEFGIQADLL